TPRPSLPGKDGQEEFGRITQFLQRHSKVVPRLWLEASEICPLLENLAMQPFEDADRQRRRRLRQNFYVRARDLRSQAAAFDPRAQGQLEARVARIREHLAQSRVASDTMLLRSPAKAVEVNIASAGRLQTRKGRRGEHVPVARRPQHVHEPFR